MRYSKDLIHSYCCPNSNPVLGPVENSREVLIFDEVAGKLKFYWKSTPLCLSSQRTVKFILTFMMLISIYFVQYVNGKRNKGKNHLTTHFLSIFLCLVNALSLEK